MYGCESWIITLKEECGLKRYKIINFSSYSFLHLPGRLSFSSVHFSERNTENPGLKEEEASGGCRRLLNGKLVITYSLSDIIKMSKSGRMR
jgi:hypothetical protein